MTKSYHRHSCIASRARGAGGYGVYTTRFFLYPKLLVAISVLFLILQFHPAAAEDRSTPLDKKLQLLQQVITLNGDYVHTVGNLQMNVTNWGFLGSLPSSQLPMADSPSAQWPAGSGIEYLYAAGLWVGARMNGVPFVSTGYPETEFYPTNDPIDKIYRSFEGDEGGNRYPGRADDDYDGLTDEDWLNGRDDDGDGKIDEDFEAISKQMFSCWYTDDQEMARIIWPEHNPMNLSVRQETFQWAEERFNEFVGVHYKIRNEGVSYLESVIIGIYADLDAGPREYGSYYMDDMVGYYQGFACAWKGNTEFPQLVNVAYVYDADGDNGLTPGYFGIAVLGHTIDVDGVTAPRYPFGSVLSFNFFQGLQPYLNGGDPTNDFERYDVLSSSRSEEQSSIPNDYRVLIGIGPFYIMPPGGEIDLHIAYVCGGSLEEMLRNAANASLIYNGTWVNRDNNKYTGRNGRETPVRGPREDYDPDPCDGILEMLTVLRGDTIWSNLDCFMEKILWNYNGCYKAPSQAFADYQTGILGCEWNVPWITGSTPPPPKMRVLPGDDQVTLLWDNLSEMTPDALTLEYDFEGYQIWRADNWRRPLGTSIMSGPSLDLWNLVAMRDLVNGVGADIDFTQTIAEGGWIYDPLEYLEEKSDLIKMFEESLLYAPVDTIPCPPGLTGEECDTLEAIARFNLGLEGGRRYYKFIDRDVKNGMHYFYSVVSYDHVLKSGVPTDLGRFNTPSASFLYVSPQSSAQEVDEYNERQIYVVPNPVTTENMDPWILQANNDDPSGLKLEFRNLPACRNTVRIFTVSGDLVQVLHHDGRDGNGTLPWNLLSRNGQEIASGIYLFSVDPDDGRFSDAIGKFIVIR
jgi:hypothetical protein